MCLRLKREYEAEREQLELDIIAIRAEMSELLMLLHTGWRRRLYY